MEQADAGDKITVLRRHPHPTASGGTYDGVTRRMFVDGFVQDRTELLNGTFSNWDPNYSLVIGNEAAMSPTFLGEIMLVALYNRALHHDEIHRNFDAGPEG